LGSPAIQQRDQFLLRPSRGFEALVCCNQETHDRGLLIRRGEENFDLLHPRNRQIPLPNTHAVRRSRKGPDVRLASEQRLAECSISRPKVEDKVSGTHDAVAGCDAQGSLPSLHLVDYEITSPADLIVGEIVRDEVVIVVIPRHRAPNHSLFANDRKKRQIRPISLLARLH
jgi:hypothetical protein